MSKLSPSRSSIAVAQISSSNDILHNSRTCVKLIEEAAQKGASCIFFPEASDFIARNSEESITLTESDGCIAFRDDIKEAARRCGIHVNIGVHSSAIEENTTTGHQKLSNDLLWIDPSGDENAKYSKLHLFDVNVPDGPSIQESTWTQPGKRVVEPVPTPIGKVGLAICFDLRFPELAAHLRAEGADILVYPSAFAVKTGQAHWEVLLRARAIETGCYVIASAQCGEHNGTRRSYGHSMVVDPWGRIIAQMDEKEEGLMMVEIDRELISQTRKAIPLQHRQDIQWKQ
jgi:predicted amidohydrolase